MVRAGEAPVVDVGPVERSLLDPQSLQEAKVTLRLRFATVAVDVRAIVQAQRAAGDPAAFVSRLAETATTAVFAAVAATARQSSCSLFDAIGPSLRREVAAEFGARVGKELRPLGLGLGAIAELSLTMDPSTEAWIRAKRASARMTPARRASSAPPEEATAVAGNCARCGAQVSADEARCPGCGGPVRPPPPCVSCGSEIRPGSRFCVNCGARAFGAPPAR